MQDPVIVRRAQRDEAEAIHHILATGFRHLQGRGYSHKALEAAIVSPQDINERIARGWHVLVAEVAGQIVGTVAGCAEHETLHVCSLAVHPAWHGRGVACRLMEALEDIARRTACRKLWLQTGWAMTEAIALYRKLGYQQEGYQPCQFYGEDFVVFGKVLESRRSTEDFLVTPQQTVSAARQAGVAEADLHLSGIAVLTFSKAVMDRLTDLCALQEARWISPLHHPYAAAEIVKRGYCEGMELIALVPPMGASPLACIVEDLVACGVQAVFLACAAWSLGPPVQPGDLIVPAFSIGPDGTSLHYGNTAQYVSTPASVVDALASACRGRRATVHVGGNASCEALYRITPHMVKHFRQRGCLCMENGEASTLLAVAEKLGVVGGALFQPYIDLSQGWQPGVLRDERYRTTCRLQAEVVLDVGFRLKQEGLF